MGTQRLSPIYRGGGEPDPWLELRNAIIYRAAMDFKEGYKEPETPNRKAEVERFFRSQWCQDLLSMDHMSIGGAEMVERIRQNTLDEIKGQQEESVMHVTLIQETPKPVETIAKIASICYDSKPVNAKGMVRKLYLNGHHSPFEHIWFTFKIEGISRACSHQLVRHRLAAITQRSQRYVEENAFDYVEPYSIAIEDDAKGDYEQMMERINDAYCDMIHLHGIKKEDARFLLPNACETEMYFSCNLRELIHIANERLCTRAQWEIREVVKEMVGLVDKDLRWMLVPKCESGFAICNDPCRGRGYTLVSKEDAEK